MTRTTLNIDSTVLRELKQRQRRAGKTLGELTSELLADALASDTEDQAKGQLDWNTESMAVQVDLEDKDALAALLDRS